MNSSQVLHCSSLALENIVYAPRNSEFHCHTNVSTTHVDPGDYSFCIKFGWARTSQKKNRLLSNKVIVTNSLIMQASLQPLVPLQVIM